ncbi:MAG: aldo/keto reductase, partial [Shimia sp.]
AAGIDTLDTAAAYGAAEAVLGRLGAARRFAIVTKVPALETLPGAAGDPAGAVRRAVEAALARLGTDRLAAVLLHRAEDLDAAGDPPWRALAALRDEGIAGRIGVSAYDPGTVTRLAARYPLDLVQMPGNVIDRRFAEIPARVALHVRSVFLQGFLLADPAALGPPHDRWRGVLEALPRRPDPLTAALAPLAADPRIERLVLGVDGPGQLDQILAALERVPSEAPYPALPRPIDPDLIDPRTWSGPTEAGP